MKSYTASKKHPTVPVSEQTKRAVDHGTWEHRTMSSKIRRPLIAFQGERGAFSQIAVHQLLGTKVEVVPMQRFEDLFVSLKKRQVEGAVIPIENTLAGS